MKAGTSKILESRRSRDENDDEDGPTVVALKRGQFPGPFIPTAPKPVIAAADVEEAALANEAEEVGGAGAPADEATGKEEPVAEEEPEGKEEERAKITDGERTPESLRAMLTAHAESSSDSGDPPSDESESDSDDDVDQAEQALPALSKRDAKRVARDEREHERQEQERLAQLEADKEYQRKIVEDERRKDAQKRKAQEERARKRRKMEGTSNLDLVHGYLGRTELSTEYKMWEFDVKERLGQDLWNGIDAGVARNPVEMERVKRVTERLMEAFDD